MLLVFANGFLWCGRAAELKALLARTAEAPPVTLAEALARLRRSFLH